MPPPQTEVLITVAGMETGRHVFAPGEYVLGRDADCHIPIEAGLVSRRHAKLTLNFDNALIEDLGSDGGTHVNGKPVAGRTRLWPNQKIQLGAATIELRRLKPDSDPDRTLAPTQEVVKRVLPEAFLREKKYDIGGVVAQGGMGAILDAKEATIERTVAMKVMLDSNAPDDLLRFLNEAKITGQLEHPNIVPVHELSVDENGQPFYTMKFVKGITLRKVLEKMAAGESAQSSVRSAQSSDSATKRDTEHCALSTEHFSLPVLLTIFQKVCDALAFAHSKGVIHRDLKPENIMVGDYGEVLVMDWGLAKRLRNTEPQGPEPVEGDIRTIRHSVAEEMPASAIFDPAALASTMAGAIMGTPQYMAPEQARGEIETLDQRADIYALGAILYRLLALRPAVTGRDSMEVVGKVGRGEIEPLQVLAQRRKDAKEDKDSDSESSPFASSRLCASHLPGGRIPDSLAAVVRKAMSLDKTARYRSVEDLQADILAYQNGFATSAENAGAWKQLTLLVKRKRAASLGIAAVLLVGGVLGTKAIIEGKRAERGEALAKSEAKRALNEAVRAERGEVLAKAEAKRAEDALASLNNTAPTFAAQATGLVEQGNLEDALEKIGYAVSLDKGNADYLLQQANLLQATQQLTEAAEGYRGVLALRSDAAAKRNLELCEKLLRDNTGSAELKRESQESLVNAMVQQGRAVEAASLSNILGKASDTALVAIKARLKPLATLPGWNWYTILKRLPDGTFRLDLSDKPIVELPPLNGLPITEVDLDRTKISDLTPLKGLRLRRLSIHGTRVSDLTPIAGMPLEWLMAQGTKIRDLTSLKGMPLKKLDLRYTSITDLRPIEGMPLHFLSLNLVPVSDLSPLAGMPIEELHLTGTKVTDIAVLRTLPLKRLKLQCPVKNLSALADCKALEGLEIPKVTTDISFLRALPNLQRLTDENRMHEYFMDGTSAAEKFWQKYDAQQAAEEAHAKNLAQVTAALPALGMAKGEATIVVPWGVRVLIQKLPVTDISGLRPLPIDALHFLETNVTDLAPLRGMRLKHLLFTKTAVKDVSPLLDMPILESAMVPQGATNLGVVRDHPTLKWLGWEGDWDKDANRPKLTTAEFWARYDAQQAAQKK